MPSEKSLANLQPQPGPEYVDTPDEYEGDIEFINWGGYKLAVHGAARMNTEFFQQIANRRESNRSVIIIITGAPGEGKSYTGLRFCQIFDKKFKILDVDELLDEERIAKERGDPSQVVFERDHFLYLVGNESPLGYGQCILPDEAQYAAGSRRWYEDIQKDLMESIESVRSRGYIIVFVALHLDLLDKIIRKFVLSFMFHVEDRGKAVVYRLYTPRFDSEMRKRRLGELRLKLPDYEICANADCLRCNFLKGTNIQSLIGFNPKNRVCKTNRALYERRKRHFVGKRSKEAEEKVESQRLKNIRIPDKEIVQVIMDNRSLLDYDKKGRMTVPSMQILVEDKLGISLGTTKSYKLRMRAETTDPTLVKEKE